MRAHSAATGAEFDTQRGRQQARDLRVVVHSGEAAGRGGRAVGEGRHGSPVCPRPPQQRARARAPANGNRWSVRRWRDRRRTRTSVSPSAAAKAAAAATAPSKRAGRRSSARRRWRGGGVDLFVLDEEEERPSRTREKLDRLSRHRLRRGERGSDCCGSTAKSAARGRRVAASRPAASSTTSTPRVRISATRSRPPAAGQSTVGAEELASAADQQIDSRSAQLFGDLHLVAARADVRREAAGVAS